MESPPVTGFRGGAFDKKVKGFDFFGQTFDFLIWGPLTCRFPDLAKGDTRTSGFDEVAFTLFVLVPFQYYGRGMKVASLFMLLATQSEGFGLSWATSKIHRSGPRLLLHQRFDSAAAESLFAEVDVNGSGNIDKGELVNISLITRT